MYLVPRAPGSQLASAVPFGDSMRIGLVACGARKLAHPAPAWQLYTSQLFRLASAYAERESDAWFVLSSKQGLVFPGTVLAPYDLHLGRSSRGERWRWAVRVLNRVRGLNLNRETTAWLILAGRAYRDPLLPHLPGAIEIPLVGLGIGRQIAWLKDALDLPQRKEGFPHTHPLNWFGIAQGIKDAAGWKCEHCQHPHDPGGGYTLTVHHLDKDPANNSYDNLVALCQRCHLHLQASYRPGQMMLPGMEPPAWMKKRNLLL